LNVQSRRRLAHVPALQKKCDQGGFRSGRKMFPE
jgi:hypothetical protein